MATLAQYIPSKNIQQESERKEFFGRQFHIFNFPVVPWRGVAN